MIKHFIKSKKKKKTKKKKYVRTCSESIFIIIFTRAYDVPGRDGRDGRDDGSRGNAPASWRSFCLTLRATGEEANLGAFC